MKIIRLSIFFILFQLKGLGQEKIILEKDFKAFRNALILKPLHAVDISHPRISLGYERMLAPLKFLSLTASIYFNNYFEAQRNTEYVELALQPTKGYGLEIEHKWFNKKLWYYAASIRVANIQYNSSHEFDWKNNQGNMVTSLEHFNAEKNFIEPSFTYGKRVRTSERWFFDFYAGVGLRLKETVHTETTAPEGAQMYPTKNLFYYRDREGTFLNPTLRGGVIIGFKY